MSEIVEDNSVVSIMKKLGISRLWGILAALLLAVCGTLLLTHPIVKPLSMTPLSGLITLKTMAAQSVPYERAIASHQPTLIEFYADWCTTCQSMSATVDRLHHQYSEQINFVMLDIDNPQWAEQIGAYGAFSVPHFTLLSPNQELLETWVGRVPAPIFNEAFTRALELQANSV